jgi:hypothetical protein
MTDACARHLRLHLHKVHLAHRRAQKTVPTHKDVDRLRDSIPWQHQRERRPDVLRADFVRSDERIRRAVGTDAQRGL